MLKKIIPTLCQIIFIFMLVQMNFFSQAQSTITTAVLFLTIAPDSRSGAMGETGVAYTDGSTSMHWNVAGLAFIEKKMTASLSYAPWLRSLVNDLNLSFLSGAYKLENEKGTIGASLLYFSLGKLILTDNSGNVLGEANLSELALGCGYARKIIIRENGTVLSLGLAGRFIYSKLATGAALVGITNAHPGTSVAGDVGLQYRKNFSLKKIPSHFSGGLAITNIGSKVSYIEGDTATFIPTNLRLGWAVKLDIDAYNTIMFTNDFNKLLVPSAGGTKNVSLIRGMLESFGDAPGGFGEELSEITIQAGVEYWYNKLLALRAGYFYEDPYKGDRTFMTVGAGIRYNVFGLDFSYLIPVNDTKHPLENSLRFTVNLDFEGLKAQK